MFAAAFNPGEMVSLRRSHRRAHRGYAALVDNGCWRLGVRMAAGIDPAASNAAPLAQKMHIVNKCLVFAESSQFFKRFLGRGINRDANGTNLVLSALHRPHVRSRADAAGGLLSILRSHSLLR
jgi:hypothetical protein